MIFRLDKRPAPRTIVILTVIGAVLLVSASIAGGLLSQAEQPPPMAATGTDISIAGRRISSYYQALSHGIPLAIASCFQAVGGALFTFGGCVYLSRRAAPKRLLMRVSLAFALLGPAVGLCQLTAAALVLLTIAFNDGVPDGLLLAIPMLSRTQLIVWTAFLWMAALGLYLRIKKAERK